MSKVRPKHYIVRDYAMEYYVTAQEGIVSLDVHLYMELDTGGPEPRRVELYSANITQPESHGR
jgi:hypothetical protein